MKTWTDGLHVYTLPEESPEPEAPATAPVEEAEPADEPKKAAPKKKGRK